MVAKKKTYNCILAYFDVLGYKNIIDSNIIPEDTFIDILDDTVKTVMKIRNKDYFHGKRANVYTFSDNFVICIKVEGPAEMILFFCRMVLLIQMIQSKLILHHGIFIRGSITHGNAYAGRNFIYGPALIRAYEIENEVAVYPRIIVDVQLLRECLLLIESLAEAKSVIIDEDLHERNMFAFMDKLLSEPETLEDEDHKWSRCICLKQDFDGEYFVDCLELTKVCGNIGGIEKIIIEITEHEMRSKGTLESELILYCQRTIEALAASKHDLPVLKKYIWVCSYINNFLNDNGIEPFFTVDSIQWYAEINLLNNKYKSLKDELH